MKKIIDLTNTDITTEEKVIHVIENLYLQKQTSVDFLVTQSQKENLLKLFPFSFRTTANEEKIFDSAIGSHLIITTENNPDISAFNEKI